MSDDTVGPRGATYAARRAPCRVHHYRLRTETGLRVPQEVGEPALQTEQEQE